MLEAAPDHGIALLRRGLLELQDAHPALALDLLQRAAAIAPGQPQLPTALGQALQAVGRFADAAASYRRALSAEPESADLHFALATALQAQQLNDAAAAAYEDAVQRRSDHFAAWNNLGICRQQVGQLAAAADAYTQALALKPDAAGALANMGTVLLALDRGAEAIALLRRALALEPRVIAHAVNLGIALCRDRQFAAAEAVLKDALIHEPKAADAAFNLGVALAGAGRHREAAEHFRSAATLRPDHADAWINLGNMHRELAESVAARSAYDAALRARPGCVVALNNLGCLLRTLGRFDEAEACLRTALEADPRHPAVHDNLGSVLKDVGELDAAIDCFRRSLELQPDNAATHGNLLYALSFQADDGAIILEEGRRWNRRFAAGLAATAAAAAAPAHDRTPTRRLRVGYVSADFRDHCQSLFTRPVLSAHDRRHVEIYCYSSVTSPDACTRELEALTDVWRDVRAFDDAELATAIRADRIDILVDLTMHMARSRPLVFARRPAPIQIAWLAYPGTTGMTAIDYRISDARLDPEGGAEPYSERTLRLPDSFWCYDPGSLEPGVNALPAPARGHVTFGCLNNPCKLSARTLELWGRVMRELPRTRLTLLAPEGRHRTNLARRLAALQIGAERVDFVPYRNRAQYLEYYHAIDIGLDTLPYNGHTTSLDALWMGVPTLTRIGTTCVGRGGLSQLHQLGLPEFAAATDDEFVDCAVRLAGDWPRLAQLRSELRPRMQRSALMDKTRFAGRLEALYRSVWSDYCRAHIAPS